MVVALGLFGTACGTSPRSRATPAGTAQAASAPRSAAPSAEATAPQQSSSSCADIQAPRFNAPAPSNRNIAIVQFKGSETYIVRDFTDILHPVSLATFNANYSPQFVGGAEVSFGDDRGLERMVVATSARSLVSRCATLFAWSPDGTALAYLSKNAELHLVSAGHNRIVESMPVWLGGVGCESQTCADEWEFRLLYSPDSAFISLVEVPPGVLRIWTPDGKVLVQSNFRSPSPDGPQTMSVWSGGSFYYRDGSGVERWHSGTKTLLFPGVSWIRPHASPAGGLIVFEARDAAGVAHVNLLDTASGKARELTKERSEPAFLSSHLIWYQEERPCTPSDNCFAGPTIPTGKTFIYDLADGTETESKIARVFDVWPRPA